MFIRYAVLVTSSVVQDEIESRFALALLGSVDLDAFVNLKHFWDG